MSGKNLEKIVVNIGVGRLRQSASFEENILPEIIKDLAAITGQKPQTRPAKKSIAGFKLREGNIVGLKITLRGKRMQDFLDRMINVVLPRVRDFRGIDPRKIDKEGNLTMGFRDHTVFPEISAEDSKFDFSFQVTLVSGAKDAESAYELFQEMKMPMRKKKE